MTDQKIDSLLELYINDDDLFDELILSLSKKEVASIIYRWYFDFKMDCGHVGQTIFYLNTPSGMYYIESNKYTGYFYVKSTEDNLYTLPTEGCLFSLSDSILENRRNYFKDQLMLFLDKVWKT